jgi:hypothetical protein
MHTRGIILVVILAVAAGLAVPDQASVDDLKARLSNVKPDDRGNICLEIAQRQVTAADKLYSDGKVEEGQAAIQDVVSYAGQAADAVSHSGRRLKNTEIAMRKMAHRLTDIKHTLASENQAPVQAAIDSLEKIRTDLLNRMFGKKTK